MQAIDHDSQKNQEEPDSLKSDLLQIITNLIKDGGDEQIKLVTGQQHLQNFVFNVLKEFSMKNV